MALQKLRKGTSGWIAKIFLVLLTFSFLVWGIADVFRGMSATDVASVGNTDISTAEFRQRYLDQVQQLGQSMGRAVTPDEARAFGLDRRVLNQMIADATLNEQAARMGLVIGDEQIAEEVRNNPGYRPPGAEAFDPDYFARLLRANGMTEQRFIAAEKQRVMRQQLVQSFAEGLKAPKVMVDAVERYEGEARNVSYILISPKAVKEPPAPTDEQLKAYFEANKMTFRAPEYRKIAVLALTPEAILGNISISDDELRAAYEADKTRFGQPERREVHQIVFTKPEDATAAAQKLENGASFADIAQEQGLSAADTNLGLVERSAILDPKVAETAFSLEKGGVSAPVKGRFGSVLVQVTQIQPESVRPFEQVRAQLEHEIAMRQAQARLLDEHDAVEDERASGSTLAETAQKLGLKLQTFAEVDRSGRTATGAPADIPGGKQVVDTAFDTDPNIEAETVQLPDQEGFVWLETLEITPARDRTFEEAKAAVMARWQASETAKAVEVRAQELLARAQAGTPLAQVAAEADLPLQIADGLMRGRANGAFTVDALQQVFDAQDGGLSEAAAATAPDRVVFQITKIMSPQLSAAQESHIAQQISQQMENDILLQYLATVQEQIGVKINPQALAQAVGSGDAN
ncbi:SurA N-terminal domain-containing protein [Xanthobacter sp. TB0139]|uniref:SurA N-terminal domain-containing protein n=1 Tax=Xanthobacter sp. TB0139 TaxID=3459178 RepID=UPI00403A7B7F